MGSLTLGYIGAGWQSWTVPAGVTVVGITMKGGGASGRQSGTIAGSRGVTPGQVLFFAVGGAGGPGANGNVHTQTGGAGGWPAGGPGGSGYNDPGGDGGGGYTVCRNGSTSGGVICVAAGAGGNSGDNGLGGSGGGPTGAGGNRGSSGSGAVTLASGGTQSSGGAHGVYPGGSSGTAGSNGGSMQGGTGGATGGLDGYGGGGGGAGFWGGGGGGGGSDGVAPASGGAGGSNYIGGLSSAGTAQGTGGSGNGSVVLTWTVSNNPPGTPAIISPTAGASTRATTSIVASAAIADPDGDDVRALFRISNDGFVHYADFYSAYAHDHGNVTATITGLAQNQHYSIRCYAQDDSGVYSTSFDTTDFYTNRTPNNPTLSSPADGTSFASSSTETFTWAFSDPDPGDTLSYSYFYYRVQGTTDFATVAVPGGTPSWTSPANFWAPGTTYEWCAQTRDAAGLWSAGASAIRTFHATGPANAPILTAQTTPVYLPKTNTLTIPWTFSDPDVGDSQSKADIRYSSDGGATWTELDAVVTTAQTYTFAANTFVANNAYNIQVRTYDSTSSVGPWSLSKTVYVYDTPLAPTDVTPKNLAVLNSSTPNLAATRTAPVSWQLEKFQWQIASNTGFTTDVKTITEDDSVMSQATTSSLVLPDVSAVNETQTWYIRVKNIDQYGNSSAWSATNTFTVSHPPTTTGLSPTGNIYTSASASTRFSWNFADTSPTDVQSAYQLIIERNDTGAGVLDTGKVTTTDNFKVIDTTGYVQDVVLRWKVRVYDHDGIVGPYSAYQLFTLGTAPTFTLVPVNNAIVDSGAPAVTWTDLAMGGSRVLTSWAVTFARTSDGVIVHQASGSVASTRGYTPPGTVLLNTQDYTLTVTITDSSGLSTTKTSFIHTSFSTPDVLTYVVDTSALDVIGYVSIDWSASTPDDSLAAWRVYRRVFGDDAWTLLAEIPNQNTTQYHDWLFKSGMVYQYTVTQVADRFGVLVESPLGYNATYVSVRTNLALNPQLVTNATNWAGIAGTGGASTTGVTRETTGGPISGTFAKYAWTTATTAVSGGLGTTSDTASIAPGDIVTCSIYAEASKSQLVAAQIQWKNSSGTVIGTTVGDAQLIDNTGFVRFVVSGIAPALTDHLTVSVIAVTGTGASNWAIGDWIAAGGVVISKTDAVWDFFDGSTPGGHWNGTVGLSTSFQDAIVVPETNSYLNDSTQYWIIDDATEDFNVCIPNVTDNQFTEEYEEELYTLIGRGRKKDYGTRLGYSGTLTAQLRGYDGSPAITRIKLEALRANQDTYWLRSPFGDLFKMAVSDMQFTPISGTGTTAMYDVSIPYDEVA